MFKTLLIALLLLAGYSLVAQETTPELKDTVIVLFPEVEIIGYQVPLIETTKRQKRKAKEYKDELRNLSPIEYNQDQISEFDKIMKGSWQVNDSLVAGTTISEHKWIEHISNEIDYPKETIEREIEDYVVIEFLVSNNPYILNPVLIEGHNQLLILTVFNALKNTAMLGFNDVTPIDGFNKIRVGFRFSIKNKILTEPKTN